MKRKNWIGILLTGIISSTILIGCNSGSGSDDNKNETPLAGAGGGGAGGGGGAAASGGVLPVVVLPVAVKSNSF